LDYLDREGLAENTIVIYTSDQGEMLGAHDYWDKRWMWDESIRMSFLIRYPREITAGTVKADMVANVDFAQTLLDYAGVAASGEMQGRSFRANLRGETPADWREGIYYRYWMHLAHHDVPAHYGIRTRDFKLIFFYGLPLNAKGAKQEVTPAGWELYDLRKDPYEMRNVYSESSYTETVKQLKAQLAQLKQDCGDADDNYPELLKRLRETE
jgi:N-acetylglucosamine-6-sulfatase